MTLKASGSRLSALGGMLLVALLFPVHAWAQPGHQHHQPPAGHEHQPPAPPVEDHSAHQSPDALPPFIPALTDEDRAAAFPDLDVHMMHGGGTHWYLLADHLEWRGGGTGEWSVKGWVGRDINRLWFRTKGDADDSGVDHASAEIYYGRAIAPWWEVVAGVRQDVGRQTPRTWAALGLQGLAPYWFEVEATAYVGTSGHTRLTLEAEYEVLLTNRLVLQPVLEADLRGKADPELGLGAGLTSTELGLRLRYEIRREFAPYVGLVWDRTYFGTADAARAAGDRVSGARLVIGLRAWR